MELSVRERDRMAVLRQVDEGMLAAATGAARLEVTRRHFWRLMRRFEAEGRRCCSPPAAGPEVEPGAGTGGAGAGAGSGGGPVAGWFRTDVAGRARVAVPWRARERRDGPRVAGGGGAMDTQAQAGKASESAADEPDAVQPVREARHRRGEPAGDHRVPEAPRSSAGRLCGPRRALRPRTNDGKRTEEHLLACQPAAWYLSLMTENRCLLGRDTGSSVTGARERWPERI